MQVIVNSTDISNLIPPKSYSVNAEQEFKSWKDGNYKEHRIYSPKKVRGKFNVNLFGGDAGMTTQQFLDLWNGAVNNDIATITVFVQNLNITKEIECYFKFTGNFHRAMINNNYCDTITVEIKEA